jgi:hypothetical protein
MVSPGRGVAANRLIAGLPARDRKQLIARCDEVDLSFGQVLDEPGNRIGHVYFPIDSYVSLVAKAAGEASLEVGLVGDEGMHGVSLVLGIYVSPLHALVQGAGPAFRMSATALRRECAARPALHRALNRYLMF